MNTQTFAARLSTLSPPRREGLTAIFRKAQERVLPTATGWLSPEDSIGRYIGKAKWDHIWEAIGPARDVFNTVAPKIKDYLEGAVEPISSRVTWSMYMIGKSASLASPSIIFCCDVLQHRREVRNTIKDSGILNDYPGIKTGHLPRPPDFDQLVPLGAGGQLPYNRGDILALTSPAKSACGSQLFVIADGTNSTPWAPVATIGGVIRLGENFYYTTAAHALEGTPDPTAADEAMLADEDYDTDNDALSLDGDEDVYSASTSSPSAVDPGRWQSSDRNGNNPEDNRFMRDDILRQWSLKRLHAAKDPLSSPVFTGKLSLRPIGKPFISSTERGIPGSGLDYTLIGISSLHHIMENVIKVGPSDETTVKVHSVAKSDPGEADIIAVTPRGTTKGRISGTPSYSSAPGKHTYVKMLKVSLQGPLDKGDCGTWVVDATNGDLFGHVVLGSPSSGSALLTPFADIFRDIVSRVGKSPTFPRARDENSSRSSEARTSSIERDEALSHIIRNTISLMGESSEPLSTRDGIDSKRTPITTMVSESHKEGTPDLGTVTERSEEPTKQAISGMESATKNLHVSKNDSAVQPEPSLDHAQQPMASNPDSAADDWVGDISEKFGRLMVQKRMKPSRQRDRIQDIPEAGVQSKSSLPKNSTTPQSMTLPHIGQPGPPLGPTDSRFRDMFFTLSKIPIKWENNELLDLALKEIDLQSIYSDAEEENEYFVSLARSQGVGTKPEWGYQDCVIRALSRYFRWTFFTRVTNPPCEACGSKLPTLPRGNTQPSQEERAGNAQAVELYQCAEKHCQAYTRFPRYLDVGTLLRTRRGRAGESSNCFGMICRALGSRVRWVWNAEDNIWIEVYSEHQQRWVHVDPCTAAWDNPLLYTEGMGRKLSYCVAFSSEGATDVTRRYVRASRHALARTRCSEAELLRITQDIKSMRRIDMSDEDLLRLDGEDTAEAQELESYTVPADTPRPSRSWHKEVKPTKRRSGIITPRKDSRESLPG
ncbi:Protein png1 [Diaporthe eres]